MAERKEGEPGEGDRESARRYDEEARRFARSGRVEGQAEEARRAMEGGEAADLEAAEREGRARAREFDPSVSRDYEEPGAQYAASSREAARNQVRAHIRELERQIDELSEQAKRYGDEARSEIEERVAQLRHTADELSQSAEGLAEGIQASTSEAWRDISTGLGEAWRSLERAFKQAGGRFR